MPTHYQKKQIKYELQKMLEAEKKYSTIQNAMLSEFLKDVNIKSNGKDVTLSGYKEIEGELKSHNGKPFHELFRDETNCSSHLKMVCYSKGLTLDDMSCLVFAPDSEEAQKVKSRISEIKNEFFQNVADENFEDLSKYYSDYFKYAKENLENIKDSNYDFNFYTKNMNFLYSTKGIKSYYEQSLCTSEKNHTEYTDKIVKPADEKLSDTQMNSNQLYSVLSTFSYPLSQVEHSVGTSLQDDHNAIAAMLASRDFFFESGIKEKPLTELTSFFGSREAFELQNNRIGTRLMQTTSKFNEMLDEMHKDMVAPYVNPYENEFMEHSFNDEAKFSENFINHMRNVTGKLGGLIVYADQKYPGLVGDGRDMANICAVLLNPENTSAEDFEKNSKQLIDDYCTKPGRKEEILKQFWTKMDNFNLHNYDLSIFSPEGMKDKETGANGLTSAERDTVSLFMMLKATQAFSVKAQENPKLFEEYAPLYQDRISFQRINQSLTPLYYKFQNVLAANGFSLQNSEEKPHIVEDFVDTIAPLSKDNIFFANDDFLGSGGKPFKAGQVINVSGKEEYVNVPHTDGVFSPYKKSVAPLLQNEINDSIARAYKMDMYDLIFIDGKSARELISEQYEGKPHLNEMDQIIGEYMRDGHKINLVTFHPDKEGVIQPVVNEVNFKISDEETFSVSKKTEPSKYDYSINLKMNVLMGNKSRFIETVCEESKSKLMKELIGTSPNSIKSFGNPEKKEDLDLQFVAKLNSTDKWYHRNSDEFNNLIEGLENKLPANEIVARCDAYISRYSDEKGNGAVRSTQMGKDRMQTIIEMRTKYNVLSERLAIKEKQTRPLTSEKTSTEKLDPTASGKEVKQTKALEHTVSKDLGKEKD